MERADLNLTVSPNSKGQLIFYAAPKPYICGFITSPTAEGRAAQIAAMLAAPQRATEAPCYSSSRSRAPG